MLGFEGLTESWNEGCPNNQGAIVAVESTGDAVWVKDDCGDGKSGVAKVIVGSNSLICRNHHGAGTWARCDWDWPEAGTKELVAGVYNANTGALDWENGTSVPFVN